jgi:hypothetical protein
MLNVTNLSLILATNVIPSFIMPNVVMLSVVAPFKLHSFKKNFSI